MIQNKKMYQISDMKKDSNKEYKMPWQDESISVLIDDTGVIGFYYNAPCNVDKVEAKDSNLMELSELQNKVKNMMLVHVKPYGKLKLTVKDMKLQVMTVPKKNSSKEALIAPVWCFTGDQKLKLAKEYQGNDGKKEINSQDLNLMRLNAIDGTYVSSDMDPETR